jgi:hypothetical protein
MGISGRAYGITKTVQNGEHVMIADLLRITDATVTRKTVSNDGYGGTSVATATTNISKCAIWSKSTATGYTSDKYAKTMTHIMALEPGAYAWAVSDAIVTRGANEYKIVGLDDDVFDEGQLMLIQLERIK